MTVGRGSGAAPVVILVVLAVSLLTTVIVVGALRDRAAPTESDAAPTEAAPSERDREQSHSAGPSQSGAQDGGGERSGDENVSAPVETVEPVGTRPQGARASRMERWQPIVSPNGSMNTVTARSTVVDTPVRTVPLDASQGLDEVAVRIADRRWEELATGPTASVPRIVWGPVERALDGLGEAQWIHAVEDAPRAEFILRFEDDRLLLRIYGSSDTVNDVEIEALPDP